MQDKEENSNYTFIPSTNNVNANKFSSIKNNKERYGENKTPKNQIYNKEGRFLNKNDDVKIVNNYVNNNFNINFSNKMDE